MLKLISESLTWICEICGESREDKFISVAKGQRQAGRVTIDRNVKFCNDKDNCRNEAFKRLEKDNYE